MFGEEEESPATGYWPSVSDLFMTLFIILIAVLAAVMYALLPKNNVADERAVIIAVGMDLGKIVEPANRLREVIGLPEIRITQTPAERVEAIGETCDTAIAKIEELKDKAEDLKTRIGKLQGLDEARKELSRLQEENSRLQERIKELESDLAELKRRLGAVDGIDIADLLDQNKELKRQLHDKPPIIRIDEAREEYRFTSASSTIGEKFSSGLRANEFPKLAEAIVTRNERDQVKIDTLEIIGHTDGAPMPRKGGNLDSRLPDVLAGNSAAFRSLVAGSNNDLGLLRALAVKQEWEKYVESHEKRDLLQSLSVRCYSAGQTILPQAVENPSRSDYTRSDDRARRIEMRLTRLGD